MVAVSDGEDGDLGDDDVREAIALPPGPTCAAILNTSTLRGENREDIPEDALSLGGKWEDIPEDAVSLGQNWEDAILAKRKSSL